MKKYILLIILSMFLIVNLFKINTNQTIRNDIKEDKNLLSYLYYENNSEAFFSSSDIDMLLANQANIYNSTYLLSSLLKTNYSFPLPETEHLKKFVSDQTFETLDNLNLFDLQRISILYSLLNIPEEAKSELGELLMKYFDSEEGLFFMDTPSEDISSKIIASNLVLNAYDSLGYIPDIVLERSYSRYENLLCSKNYFTLNTNEFKKNVFDEAFIILDSVRILANYDVRFEPLLTKQEDWFKFWYAEINTYANSLTTPTLSASSAIINFNKFVDSFHLPLLNPEKYANLIDLEFLSNIFYYDIQMFFNHLQVYLLNNNPQNLTPLFDNIIYKEHFYTSSSPQVFTSDIFFGTNLADNLNLNYNAEKLLKYLDTMYLGDSNLSIPDYFWLTCSYLNLDHKYNQSFRYQIIKKYLENRTDYIDFANTTYRNFYYALKLDDIYNLNLDFEKAYSNLMKDLNLKNIKYIEDVYFLQHIITEFYPNINFSPDQWIECVMDFYNNDGGFVAFSNADVSDIISTYYALHVLITSNADISKDQLKEFKSFLTVLRGTYGGYFIHKPSFLSTEDYKDFFSLDSFWYGYNLNHILKKLESK